MKSAIGILLLSVILLTSCKEEKDQIPYCTFFYFKVVSNKTGEDLIFGANPQITDWVKDVVFCNNYFQDGVICSNEYGRSFGKHVVAGQEVEVLGTLLCEENVEQKATITIKGIKEYKIKYKLLDVDTFYKDINNYFIELYVDDKLVCAPCEVGHITVFTLDI